MNGDDDEKHSLMLSSSSALHGQGSASRLPAADYGGTTTTRQEDSDYEDDDGSLPEAAAATAKMMPLWNMTAILTTAFCYGCIMTTLFLITLPIECERISVNSNGNTPKSVALGAFVAIAGFTQLVSPLIGRLSDTYEPPRVKVGNSQVLAEVGQRMPYYVLGGIVSVLGLMGQMFSSESKLWIRYGFCFFFSMVGLNIQYAMMIALIPDQILAKQTGTANGVLALLLVTGSLFGFGLFHTFLSETIASMYGLYTCIVIASSILTGTHAHDRDAELTAERIKLKQEHHHHCTGNTNSMMMDDDNSSHHSSSATAHYPPGPSPRPHKWRRRAHRAAKKAVKHAHQIIVLTPALIVKSMLDPLHKLSWSDLYNCYTIDMERHHDFFVVTVSRLFYYCGMSVQSFFLYFVHDIIGVRNNPEAAVATLAILGQCSGALTCYPVGVVSDYLLGGRRTPFVYAACFVLGTATLTLMTATTFHQMTVFCLILGAANGVYLTMETSMAVDTLPKDLLEGDDDDVGNAQLLGIWGVAAFLGSALGPMIGGPLLYLFGSSSGDAATATGDDERTVEEYTLKGYAVVLTLSGLYFYASAITLRFLRDHHE